MTVHGVDLSDFDRGRGPVDVAAMARDGIVFLTHKATEGTKVQHAYYGQTLNQALAAGIPFLGAYFVPRSPGNNGHGSIQEQVAFFLAYLDSQTPWWRGLPEFFLQVDTEHWGYDDVAPQYGAQAADLLRAQTGKWVIHYAPAWAYGDTIPGGDPLWASAYGDNPAVPYRQAWTAVLDLYARKGWGDWPGAYSGRAPIFWQFGSRATVGSQPGCDINAFRGTLDELRALITGGVADMDPNAQDIVKGIGNAEALRDIWQAVVEGRPGGAKKVGRFQFDNGWDRESAKLDGIQATIAATAAANEVRDKTMQVTVDGLVKALGALTSTGTTDVNTATIVANQNAVRDEARAEYAKLHAENAGLKTQLAAYQAKEAAAAKAAADALNVA